MHKKTTEHIKSLFVVLVIMFEGFFKNKSLDISAVKGEIGLRNQPWDVNFPAEMNTIDIQIKHFCT